MKDTILKVVSQMGDVALTAFKNHLPEAKGEFDFLFPVEGVENTNILLLGGCSQDFILAIGDLISNGILTFEPCSLFVVNADGGEIYDLPIAKAEAKKVSYQTLHWLPILIKKGKNFPKTT